MKRQSSLLSGIAALAIGLAGSASGHGNDGPGHGPDDLVGVWQISGQPVNCATGQALPVPPIAGIIAFHAGGTSTEAAASATPRTPGLGTWRRIGSRKFEASATVLNYDVNGFSTGSLIVRRTFTLSKDGKSLAGTGRTLITDASGIETLRCSLVEAVPAKP